MRTSILQKLALCLLVSSAAGWLGAPAHGAVVTLDPLIAAAGAPGNLLAGGLNGAWYKVNNDARLSTQIYTDEKGVRQPIKDFSWGTGIWAATDIANISSGTLSYATTSKGGVSYANNIYNNTVKSGTYGTWGQDYIRPLAPIVGGANSCVVQPEAQAYIDCPNETNYAAIFTGYLYVAAAGIYDFGVFSDDGFIFSLNGLNGSLGMDYNSVAGSKGRVLYSLQEQTHSDGLDLNVGYYGIELSYFNRLEAGVIELGWKGPGADSRFTTIDPRALFAVPEPASLALVALGLLAMAWRSRRHSSSTPLHL